MILLIVSLSSCGKKKGHECPNVEVTQDYSDFQEVDESDNDNPMNLTPDEEYLINMRIRKRTFYI